MLLNILINALIYDIQGREMVYNFADDNIISVRYGDPDISINQLAYCTEITINVVFNFMWNESIKFSINADDASFTVNLFDNEPVVCKSVKMLVYIEKANYF